MDPTADALSWPPNAFPTELDVSDAPDSKTLNIELPPDDGNLVNKTNGSTKLSPLTSARPASDPRPSELRSPDVVTDTGEAPWSPTPSNEHNYTSELYISPAPSITLCSRPPLLTEDTVDGGSSRDKAKDKLAGAQFADTKAELADRRSNFFNEITRAPVLLPPSSVSHSSVLSFQPTANVVADPRLPTTNGHSELSINLVQPTSAAPQDDSPSKTTVEHAATAPRDDSSSKKVGHAATAPRDDSPSKTAGRTAVAAAPQDSPSKMVGDEISVARETVVILYQAAPPPDSAELFSPVGLWSSPAVVLEVDEDALAPRFCARMEPSPERFWGPSVTPVRAAANCLLRGNERTGHVAELRLVGSAAQLEAMEGIEGCGRNTGGDVRHLGMSSTPSPQETPLTKGASKDPSSSTSTDSLPTTPSSANLPSSSQAKSGNLEKIRTFFGENAPKMFESKSDAPSAEPSSEPVAELLLTETKKTDLQKSPVTFDVGGKSSSTSDRSFKNKKGGWSLGSKSHGTRSPGARPKKSTERTDTGESPKHKQTWRGKMARTILRYGSGPILSPADVASHVETLGVIGVPLEFCASSPFNELVPLLVSVCTRVVEEKGLTNQGIYRVPGNTGAINLLIEEMTKDPSGLCLESEKWQDVNLVSSLLKLFFRKLPDSLITDELYDAVIDANRLDNSTRRMLKLKKLLHELPEQNFETFHFLAQHLSRVASHEEENKMDARNLAIVFGPTLVRPQDNDMVNMVRDMTDQCRIIESIILHCDWFFGSWDEDVNVPIDDDSEELAPISGMNDELLAKAESLALTHHVNSRDVVQMIVKAANRKLRNRGKTKLSGSDGDSGPYDGNNRSSVGSPASAATDPKSGPKLLVPDSPPTAALSEEVLLDVKKYPAYHFDEISFLSTENAKPRFRRTHSDDCLLLDSPPARVSCPELLTVRTSRRRFAKPFVSLCSEDPCAVTEQENGGIGRRFYYAT